MFDPVDVVEVEDHLEGLVEVDDDPAGVAEEEQDHDHHQHARHRAVPPATYPIR